MENVTLCQSCGLPLDKESQKGNDKNGLKTDEYCKYCYEYGAFKNPKMNLEDMKNTVETHMKKLNIPHNVIKKAVNILPALGRWRNK
jgi:hypothetical protein